MVEMTRSISGSLLGSEFDDFLFAPIGTDRNGTLLSVLSALARLDVDPWQEAAKLARLPGDVATQRLASLIAALPDGLSRDPGAIAAGLIPHLPRPASSKFPSRETLLGAGAATNSRTVIFVILMALALVSQYIMASRQPPAPVDKAHAPASSKVPFPQMPPPSSGH